MPARLGGGERLGERLGSRSCLCQARLQHHRQPHARTPQSRSQLSPCLSRHRAQPSSAPFRAKKRAKISLGSWVEPGGGITREWHRLQHPHRCLALKAGHNGARSSSPVPCGEPKEPLQGLRGHLRPHVPKPWAVALGRR